VEKMGKIIILDELTSNQIAAGEVVERPASVAKEMIENSLDAGATSISVEIENGGISLLRITDNGSGIEKDDMAISFERHATSKIRSAKDLKTISSFGFRGEALASIASVAEVEMVSRYKGESVGNRLVIKGGNIIEENEIGCNQGTIMTVKDLFYNTPARYKFLKKDYTEAGYVEDVVAKMALIHSNVAFKYVNSKKVIIQTSGDGNIINAIYSVYGKDIAKSVIPFELEFEGIKVNGVAGKADTCRNNRSNQIFFVNGRYIKNKTMSSAVDNAYQTIAPAGKFPFVVINVEVNSELVDVNVHPTKTEVRFSDESLIYRAVYNAIRSTMLNQDLVPEDEDNIKEEPKKTITDLFSSYKKVGTYASRPTNDIVPKANYSYKPVNQSSSFAKPSAKEETVSSSEYIKKDPYVPIKERNESLFSDENNNLVQNVKNYKIIGTVFSTYILIQQNDDFYIIDQHAAHERVMYESLVKKVKNGVNTKQMLMIPEIVELKNNEVDIVNSNKELFDKAGFEMEEFGGNSFKISAVPGEITGIAIKELFYDLVDSLQKESGVKEDDRVEYFIFTMACKAAVKANMNLDNREIEALIDKMMSLENPFTCPHGRPTAIKITKSEMEKKFKRSGF
jgi:DNA mismatch repair protein MutL